MTKEDAMMKGSSLIFPPNIYPDPTDPHQVSSFISSYLRTFIPRGIVNEAMLQTENQYWTMTIIYNKTLFSGSPSIISSSYNITRRLPDVINIDRFMYQEENAAKKNPTNDDINKTIISDKSSVSKWNIKSPYIVNKVCTNKNIRASCNEFPSSSLNCHQSKEDKTCNDLIYLRGPCTEAAIINMLKVRFNNNQLQV